LEPLVQFAEIIRMKIVEAAFVGYPVSDVARARQFYEETLGLAPEMCHEIDGMPGVFWIEYNVGNVTLAISNSWPPSGQSGPSIALEVEDFEASVAELKAAGVQFAAERMESPVCDFALIADPDGNGITIHKRKPGHG
jgi:predicted enzyme related to lactoylglutathione lyase